MNKQKAEQLLDKYLQGTASKQEEALVQYWLVNWVGKSEAAKEDKHENLKAEMWEVIAVAIGQEGLVPDHVGRKRRPWPKIAGIAAAVATIVFGVWFFNYKSGTRPLDDRKDPLTYTNDVAPGKYGATITLVNGKVIHLDSAKKGVIVGDKLRYDDGSALSSSRGNSEVLVATTAKGQTYSFTLPDGSKVWLNANSKLEFPSSFANRKERKTKLSGEGYFEIAKSYITVKGHKERQPFIVETVAGSSSPGQQVEVLGTQFNVNSYPEEPVLTTTLLEGSVKVGNVVIKPGQQILNDGHRLEIQPANIERVTDWKDGNFNLNDLDLDVAMRKIARWYDVEVIYDDQVNKYVQIGGWIPRDRKLSVVLKAIQSLGIAHFTIEGRKVYVKR